MYAGIDADDDLSTALGTETLTDRDIVPAEFGNTASSSSRSADTLLVEVYERRGYLRVERSATLRNGAKVSRTYSFNTCNVYRMRENLQQRKEVLDTKEKCLADNTLKATECLKALWDKGLVRGKQDI